MIDTPEDARNLLNVISEHVRIAVAPHKQENELLKKLVEQLEQTIELHKKEIERLKMELNKEIGYDSTGMLRGGEW